MEEKWALLWSKAQNALHVEPFERTLSANRDAYRDDRGGDYRVLYVGLKADVESAADSIRPTLVRRDFNLGEAA